METLKDMRGVEIRVGDTIAYPDRRGAHLFVASEGEYVPGSEK